MAEKRTIELEVQSNTKSLKAQLKEAQMEVQKLADKYGATSQEAIKAAKGAAELKDQIGDAKALTDAFNPDAKFKAFTSTLSGVAGGFSAVQGAMGLVGVEGEAVQATMLKVQSAMAISQGLQALGEAKDSFAQLGGVIRDTAIKLGILTVSKEADVVVSSQQTAATVGNVVATEAQAGANVVAGASFKTMGTAAKVSLNGIKGAIAATGIGLLVVALGVIVAYWDDIKAAVNGVSAEMNNNLEVATKNAEQSKRESDNFKYQENSLKLQGLSEREILKLRIQKGQESLKDSRIQLESQIKIQKASEIASERNFKVTKQIIDMMTISPLLVIIDLASAGIIGLMKTTNAYMQQFQGVIINVLSRPIEMALKGANQVSKALGLGGFDVKGLMGDITKFATDSTKQINETIQGLKPTNLQKTLGGGLSGWLTSQIFDPEGVKEEGKKTIQALEDNLEQIESEIDGNKLAIQDIDKRSGEAALKTQEDIEKQKQENLKIYNDNLKAFYAAQEADRQARIVDAAEKELQELANKFDEQSLIYDNAEKDTTELTKQYEADRIATKEKYRKLDEANAIIAEEKLQKFMQEADAKAFADQVAIRELEIKSMQDGSVKELAIKKLALDQELVNLQNQKDAKLLTEEQYQTLSREANARYEKAVTDNTIAENDKRIKADNAAYEQKAALQMQALDLAAQGVAVLTDIFGKNKAVQKGAILVESAVGIAKMIISNKLANIAALATPQAIASSGATAVPVIAMNNISTGLGIAANIAATAKALKELGGGSAPSAGGLGGGGGAGGAGGGMGVGTQTPQFNVVGNNGINQLAQLQMQPVKAYVVSGDVSSAQSLDRNRITNGTI